MKRPDLPEIEGHVANPAWPGPQPTDLSIRRLIVDWFGVWDECRHVECRRAKACRSRSVLCFDEERPLIIDIVYDFLLEGYLVDLTDEEDG